ncbi:MAG: cob(I)yrinic acid a,c-diamide adenosyltransferase [Candidatus Beckwithbacteria bacterium]|nr:cob(I)yrinic acid a,c-diamide adenosyltransferase [Patescibacteria group bacterium]
MKQGLVYVFTGDGKGKTSAALGIAVRAVCNKMKVGWVSWYKEEVLPSGSVLEGRVEMYVIGKGFYKLPGDKATPEEHKQAAKEALKKAEELIKRVDVLVMDEVVKAVADGLIEEKEVMRVLKNRGKTHVVLTGRGVTGSGLVTQADLVTECKKIKHPFDKGVKAVKGLDY